MDSIPRYGHPDQPKFEVSAKLIAIYTMAKTTLEKSEYEYETEDGTQESVQFKTTLPKGLVEAMGWEGGDKLTWSVESGGKLSVEQNNE